MILGRKSMPGISYTEAREVTDEQVDPAVRDPLSQWYKTPEFLVEKPYPFQLVSYWEWCLSKLVKNGEERGLPNGKGAALSAAKTLINKCNDIELAARVVKYTADDVDTVVSLWRAIDRIDKVKAKLERTDF